MHSKGTHPHHCLTLIPSASWTLKLSGSCPFLNLVLQASLPFCELVDILVVDYCVFLFVFLLKFAKVTICCFQPKHLDKGFI